MVHDDQQKQQHQHLIDLANNAIQEEKLLLAARLLRKVQQSSNNSNNNNNDSSPSLLLTEQHYELLQTASECEEAIADLLIDISNNKKTSKSTENDINDDSKETKEPSDDDDDDDKDDEWIQQDEVYGKYRTNVYYKYPKGWSSSTIIVCRLEAVIPASLLVPLLCVLNESSLYTTWIPYWTSLNLGLKLSQQLQQISTVNQILYLYGYCPWPFSPRQVLIKSIAIDETDNSITDTTTPPLSDGVNGIVNDTNNDCYIAVHLNSLDPDTHPDIALPEEVTGSGAVSVDFTGTFLFRPCPTDHHLLTSCMEEEQEDEESAADVNKTNPDCTTENSTNNTDKDTANSTTGTTNASSTATTSTEPMLLVSFKMTCDPHMTGVPQRIINYVLRKGLGQIWGALLLVAEQVQDGTRELHADAIRNKPSIYQFIQTRCDYMISKLQQEQERKQNQKI